MELGLLGVTSKQRAFNRASMESAMPPTSRAVIKARMAPRIPYGVVSRRHLARRSLTGFAFTRDPARSGLTSGEPPTDRPQYAYCRRENL